MRSASDEVVASTWLEPGLTTPASTVHMKASLAALAATANVVPHKRVFVNLIVTVLSNEYCRCVREKQVCDVIGVEIAATNVLSFYDANRDV